MQDLIPKYLLVFVYLWHYIKVITVMLPKIIFQTGAHDPLVG